MVRTHFKNFSVAETEVFLCEKTETAGDIAIATLTGDKGFAAKKDQFVAGRRF